MQDHLVFISLDLPIGELPHLVRVHGPLGFIHIDEDILFFFTGGDLVTGYGAFSLVKRTSWH